MNELFRLREDVQAPHGRCFDLGEFLAEILYHDAVQTFVKLHWLLADELKASVEVAEDLSSQKSARLKSLLYVRILGGFSYSFEDGCHALFPVPDLAQQRHDAFLGFVDGHKPYSLFTHAP